jgi:hypothetical protein
MIVATTLQRSRPLPEDPMPLHLLTSRDPRAAALVLALVLALPAASAPAAGGPGEWPIEFRRQWVWTTFGSPIGEGGMEIVDLDGDGVPELVATADVVESPYKEQPRWFEARYTDSIRQTWSSLTYPGGIRFLRVVGPPGAREVLVADDDEAFIYEAATKHLARTIITSANGMTAVEVGDIDALGGLELVVCDNQTLYVYNYVSGEELAVRYGFGCTDLELGQTDADSALEIALAGNAFGGLLLDGVTLQVDWAYLDGFGPSFCLMDVDHDALDEVVAQTPYDSDLQALDPTSGNILWLVDTDYLGPFRPVDVDGTGDEELVYSEYYPDRIRALEETDGSVMWTIAVGNSYVEALAAGDIDADGHFELVWSESPYAAGGTLHVWDLATSTLESETEALAGPFPGVHAADMDADGSAEVVATSWSSSSEGSDAGGRHLYFDAVSHDLERMSPPLPATYYYNSGTQRTLVLQIDADEPLEICTAFSEDYNDSFVRCEDGATFALEWQVTLPEYRTAHSLAAAQLDGDPAPELVIGTSAGVLFALEAESGWLKYQSPPLGSSFPFQILRIGDVLGDDAPEIVASNGDYYYDPLVIFDGATGALLRGPWDLPIGGFDLAQLDADAAFEIVTGTTDGDISVLDAATGQLGPALATFPASIYALRVADTTLDGVLDFNVVSGYALGVWGGAEDQVVWTGPYLGPDAGMNDTLWVDDYDLDQVPDLVVNTGYGFAIFEAPLSVLLRDGFESGDTSAWSATVP